VRAELKAQTFRHLSECAGKSAYATWQTDPLPLDVLISMQAFN
jgi:hypothetical protein